MCTLILLHRCVDGAPLVVAANRDEYLDRPAAPPALLAGGGLPVAAPLDLRAGGTWLGVNRAGLFAALTNRPTRRPDPARRSRGLLVLDALEQGSAAAAAERLGSLPVGLYNPFNLVLADRDRAFALVYGEAPKLERLEPGAHVIGNADPLAPDVPKVARLRACVEAASRRPAQGVLEALGEICRTHEGSDSPLEDTCIHTPAYGTRSSTLLRLGTGAETDAFRFADGPPCRTAYADFTHLLGALDRAIEASPGPRIARTAS
jgi:uncharacterized protein with NRDE domain